MAAAYVNRRKFGVIFLVVFLAGVLIGALLLPQPWAFALEEAKKEKLNVKQRIAVLENAVNLLENHIAELFDDTSINEEHIFELFHIIEEFHGEEE